MRLKTVFALVAGAAMALGGCGSSSDYEDSEVQKLVSEDSDHGSFGEDERGGETYDEFDERRNNLI